MVCSLSKRESKAAATGVGVGGAAWGRSALVGQGRGVAVRVGRPTQVGVGRMWICLGGGVGRAGGRKGGVRRKELFEGHRAGLGVGVGVRARKGRLMGVAVGMGMGVEVGRGVSEGTGVKVRVGQGVGEGVGTKVGSSGIFGLGQLEGFP
jgi:hypothetical protein